MIKRKKATVLFLPLFILICFFALKFWAQVVIPEYDMIFTESFDNTDFKDEEKSSVNHWGDGYITLNLAGIFQQIPTAVTFPTWINMAAHADFDSDGLVDVIGTSDDYPGRITFIKNEGEGIFVEKSPPYLLNENVGHEAMNSLLAGDFDDDGDQDFMYLRADGVATEVRALEAIYFFEHQGWVDANGIPQFTIRDYTDALDSDLKGLGWMTTHQTTDFDGDGDLDILFCEPYGLLLLVKNDAAKPLSDTTKFLPTSTLIDAKVGEPGSRWDERGVSTLGRGDFDGDGDVDVILGSVNWRGLKYYKNDGTGNFTLHDVLGDMSGSDLHDDLFDGACTAMSVGDYDEDGDLDFIIGTDNWNIQEQKPPNYTTGSLEGSHPCPTVDTWQSGTTMGAKCFYFKNDGSGEFTSSLIYDGPQLIADGECAAWDFDFSFPIDFDGDGDLDVFMADGNHSEFFYIFENILYNIFNTDGTAVSTNITAQSFPPDGLDREAYAITKVQFTALDQSVQGSNSGLKVTYYVSNNGGRDWELYAEFEEGDIHNYNDLPVHTFSTFGSDARWKAEMSAPDDYPPESEFSGTSMDTPKIERIEIKATYVEKQEYSRTSVVVTNVVDENDQRKRYLLASTFYFPSWEGHLRAYDLSGMTPESTSNSVLRTVSRPDLSESSGREIVPSGVEILWDAGELLDARSAASRTVYTATPVDSVLTRVDFTASSVGTLGPILQDVNNNNEGLIDYIRGEGRDWKLGDSNHSNPVVVGPPDRTVAIMGDGYQDFMNTWVDRRKVVYVGANDGMIHCFDVLTGEELWGFIPYNLLPKLKNMWAVDAATGERYFARDLYVDGSPMVADVYIDADGDASQEWTTILISGQGAGNGSTLGGGTNYYFALDITDPENPQPLWEFTHDFLGETWSVPVVGKIRKNGEDAWLAFMGSGYDNNPSEVVGNTFYAVDLETGEYFWKFCAGEVDTTVGQGWNIPNTIPGSPSIIDMDQDGHADRVYVPDLDGRVWKVDVSIEYQDPTSWEAVVIYEDSRNYPIISKPTVWINYVSGGTIPRLFFGTGGDDRAPSDGDYSFIDLLDAPTPEVEWYLGDPAILNLPEAKDVGDLSSGERVWADPKVADYIVYFSTLKGNIESVDPTENILGIGRLYARFVQTVAGSIIGGTALTTASGSQENIALAIKTRAAVTFGERERASDGTRKREVYIQEYDSTIQKLEQSIGAILKIKSWREIYRVIR